MINAAVVRTPAPLCAALVATCLGFQSAGAHSWEVPLTRAFTLKEATRARSLMRAHTYESATGTPEEPGTLRVDAVGVAAGELDPLNRLINRVERTNQVRAARTPQVIVFSKTSGNPTMRKEISAILRMYKAESKLWLQAEGLVGDAVIDVYHAPDVDSVRVDLKFTPGWRTGDVLLLASNGATLVEDGFGGPNGPPARKG